MSQSRVWIAKNIGFPLQEIIKKTSIIEKLDFLKESQFWDEDRINEYQLTKLKNIIDYSSKNVPCYELLFKKIKLNSDDIKYAFREKHKQVQNLIQNKINSI